MPKNRRLEASIPDPDIILVPTSFVHGSEGCGDRVGCPCGLEIGPYHSAERLVRSRAVIIWCGRCRQAWREVTP
jgi:hypothetical protein